MKNNSEPGDVDLSVLRKPIPTSVTGFMGVMKVFGEGTAEMRRVLERECDIIYECKVCRNIFRDVANLMTHKRLYCKTAFNSNRDFHFPDNGFIDQSISSVIEQEDRATRAEGKRDKSTGESLPKDIGGLVHKMRIKQVLSGSMKPSDFYELVNSKVTLEDVMKKKHLLHLQDIPETNVAVYQTVESDNGQATSSDIKGELMKREVDEVNKLSAKSDVVVGPDGKALKLAEFRETVTKEDFEIESIDELMMLCGYDEDAEVEPHECAICDARFETEKTLILHIQLKHISSTKVYQCPSCSQTFMRASLVIKHLSNDHKKSLKKIRSMRETIHKRHMRIDEVQVKGPSRELNRLQTEKERIEAENNKAYLDNVANFDNMNQSMCTYCNKIFERKAVLSSHMISCRIKFEKSFVLGITSNGSQSAPNGGTGAKRGPKGGRENGTKDKEVIHDENSLSSSDGGASNEASPELTGDNSNGSASVAATGSRKRKIGRPSSGTAVKKTKKTEGGEQQHSKVTELLTKQIWNPLTSDDRDDSYFSFDDKAPEDARDETYKRRFACDTCNKSFSTMSNLKRHNVMFHYFQSRYRCNLCGYRAMKKNEAMAHLRAEHQMDKEEHEMKSYLEQEKNEVSSSEVLELDIEEGSSNQGRSASTGRDNSRSPVPQTTTTNASSVSTANSSSSSGVSSNSGSSSSPTEAPPVPRKRGRPKGSFKVKTPKSVPAPERSIREETPTPRAEPEVPEVPEVKKKSSSTGTIPPLPPQVDNNSSSSSTSSRPIRNRTKPKDKDFVYDYSILKGDFLYEDDAMASALTESMLSATSSALNGSPTTPEVPVNVNKKFERSLSNGEPVGDGPKELSVAAPQKRGVGRPKTKNLLQDGVARGNLSKVKDSDSEKSLGGKLNQQRSINWDKNVIIPTRIIEHRHSVGDRARGLVHLKEEIRRNSIEIMTKSSGGGGGGGGNVKENNRPPFLAGPLGVIGNIMEARAAHREGDVIKEIPRQTDDLTMRHRHFLEDPGTAPGEEPHILLNGRSRDEIKSLNNSIMTGLTTTGSEESSSS